MTPTPDEICERLRRSVTDTTAFCPSPVYRNPDGPEAAALIQQQQATIERLSAALEPFAGAANYADALKYDDADYVDVAPFTAGDFRKARAALGKDAK